MDYQSISFGDCIFLKCIFEYFDLFCDVSGNISFFRCILLNISLFFVMYFLIYQAKVYFFVNFLFINYAVTPTLILKMVLNLLPLSCRKCPVFLLGPSALWSLDIHEWRPPIQWPDDWPVGGSPCRVLTNLNRQLPDMRTKTDHYVYSCDQWTGQFYPIKCRHRQWFSKADELQKHGTFLLWCLYFI